MLTNDGIIHFIEGYNSERETLRKYSLLNIKFKDIETHNDYNILAALSENNFYFVWGDYGGAKIDKPKQIEFNSFYDLFFNYLEVTHKTMDFSMIGTRAFNPQIKTSRLISEFGVSEKLNGKGILLDDKHVEHQEIDEDQKVELNKEQDEKPLKDQKIELCEEQKIEVYKDQGLNGLEQKEAEEYEEKSKSQDEEQDEEVYEAHDEVQDEEEYEVKDDKDVEQDEQSRKKVEKLLTSNILIENIFKSFNDPKYSDLKFKIENKHVYVNKFILKLNCEYFDSKLTITSINGKDSNEKNEYKDEIEIENFSYDVYYAFLKYIYTDSIDIVIEKAMDLFILANEYKEEILKQKCFDVIKNGLNIENVLDFYRISIREKLDELEKICFEFAFYNLKEVKETETFRRMDENSMKNFKIKVFDFQNE
jgi:hypothetical protein